MIIKLVRTVHYLQTYSILAIDVILTLTNVFICVDLYEKVHIAIHFPTSLH